MMTRWVMLASVLGVVAVACGDDGPTGQLADAPPAIDARVVDSMPRPDGPEIDAPPIDAPQPPPGVTVTVTAGGVPAPGQTVYFQSRDSATTATVITDLDGVATSPVEAGGFVTVLDPLSPTQDAIGSNVRLTTYAGVQPGDHLFRDVPGGFVQSPGVEFTISVPNEEQNYDYTLYSTCGQTFIGRGAGPVEPTKRRSRGRKAAAIAAAPVTADVRLFGCHGRTDLLVVGTDSEGGVHSWQYKPDVALIAEGTVTFDSYATVVDQTYSFTATQNVSRVQVSRELRTAHGSLYTASATAFFDGPSASTTIPMPTPAGVVAITTVTEELFQGTSQASYIDWGANTDYALDIPATDLHDFVDAPRVDTATHAVVWSENATGQPPQLTITTMRATRSDETTSHTWTWNLVAPWQSGSAALPVLPTTLFDFTPVETDDLSVFRLTTAKVPGGYDAARPRVFAGDLAGGVAGASGQIVFEDLFINSGEVRQRTVRRAMPRAR